MAEFICNLKKYRQLKELTQEQLADIVGVRRETIMRLEAGKYNPSLKLAIDISKVVDVPIEEIFIFDWINYFGEIVVGYFSRPSLPKIIQGFKSVTTRMCFKYNYKSIWQGNYYEHIIRNQEEYEKINEYIQTNLFKWQEDKYYI